MRTTMRVAACVARRSVNERCGHGKTVPRHLECVGCEQGVEAAAGRLNDEDIKGVMVAVMGREAAAGRLMDNNIDRVMREVMVGEKGMDQCTGETGGTEAVPMVVCSHGHAARPKGAKCRECVRMWQKEWARRKARGENGETVPPERKDSGVEEGARKRVLSVDLTEHPEIWDEIGRIARDEERTMEQQVRYWLRARVRAMQGGKTA